VINGWRSGGNGQDTYGFSALPGGYGDSDRGGFFTVGEVGFWWSSNLEYGNNLAYLRLMIYTVFASEKATLCFADISQFFTYIPFKLHLLKDRKFTAGAAKAEHT